MEEEKVKFVTLDKGLKVIAKNIPYVESVSIIVWLKTGSRYEPERLSGISHLIEHLVFKGSKKRKTALEISLSIEGIGGKINAFTSEEYTGFYVKVPASYLSLGMDILSDMLYNPLLRKDDIEKEKRVVIEEISRYYDIPEEWVDSLLIKALWGKHPLGRDILGTVNSVMGIEREDIKDYMDKFYVPLNITLSIAGKISFDDIFEYSKKYFLVDKDGVPSKFLEVEKDKIQGEKFIVEHRDINQTHLSLAFISFPRGDKRRYALTLLNIILGGGMSSRLFQKIREEKGLVYDIGSYPAYFSDTGILKVSAGIDSKRTEEALSLILKEINGMKKFDNKEELKRAKEYYKGSFLISLEDSLSQSSFIGKWAMLENKPPDIKEFIRNIEKTSIEDIRDIANTIFTYQRGAASLILPKDVDINPRDLFSEVI